MKEIRVLLVVCAFPLAIAGAYTSNIYFTAYEFKIIDGEKACIPREAPPDCGVILSSIACTIIAAPAIQLRRDNNPQTNCGPLLYKHP